MQAIVLMLRAYPKSIFRSLKCLNFHAFTLSRFHAFTLLCFLTISYSIQAHDLIPIEIPQTPEQLEKFRALVKKVRKELMMEEINEIIQKNFQAIKESLTIQELENMKHLLQEFRKQSQQRMKNQDPQDPLE